LKKGEKTKVCADVSPLRDLNKVIATLTVKSRLNATAALNVEFDGTKESIMFDGHRQGTVRPSGSTVYAHSLHNNGNTAFAAKSMKLVANNGNPDWRVQIFADPNNTGSLNGNGVQPLPEDGVISDALAAKGKFPILVRVTASSSAVIGDKHNVKITLLQISDSKELASSTISTLVTDSQMNVKLMQTEAKTSFCTGVAQDADYKTNVSPVQPGMCVWYRVVATNYGTEAVNDVELRANVPAHTDFVSAAESDAKETQRVVSRTVNTIAPQEKAVLSYRVKISE
jgi:hypothetical protein